MLQKKSKAVPESNDPTPQDAYAMITWEELRRVLSESMGSKAFGEFKEDLRKKDRTAFCKPRARRSAVTSCHGCRRSSRQEDSRAHGGRRCCNSSKP